jgi:hypothetical protein
MPYATKAELVLAGWRVVERARESATPDSIEERLLQAEAKRLNREYQELIEAARAAQRPLPAPWREESTS